MGQGANQALQDAYCLAKLIVAYNNNNHNGDVSLSNNAHSTEASSGINAIADIGDQLEHIRKLPTTQLIVKSSILGLIETLGGPWGCFVKDYFFRVTAALGVIRHEFITGVLPKIE